MTQETLLDQTAEGPIQTDKYKDWTKEDLEKAKLHADTHIEIVERENKELRDLLIRERDENLAKAKMDEMIKKLDEHLSTSNKQPEVNETLTQPQSPEQIEGLVSKKIQEYEFTKKSTDNFNQVKAKLQERFGNNYQTIIKDQIDKLGLTIEDVDALARKSPNAFFNTLGIDITKKPETFQTPPKSSGSFMTKTPELTRYSQYQELRKANPKLYHDRKFQIEIEKKAQEIGEAFFDT